MAARPNRSRLDLSIHPSTMDHTTAPYEKQLLETYRLGSVSTQQIYTDDVLEV